MKKYIKLIIDICMIILISLLFSIKNNILHEILGIVFLLFLISHIILNFKELKALIKNKLKLIYLVIVAVCALAVITAGILNSQFVFSFIKISNLQIFRSVHMFASMVLFILAAIHAGVSIKNIKEPFALGMKTNKAKAIASKVIIILIMLYGVYACYSQSIWNNFSLPFNFRTGNEINFNQNKPSPPEGSGQDNNANNGSSGVDSSNNYPSSNADNQNNSNSSAQDGTASQDSDKKTPPNNNGKMPDGKITPQAQSLNSKWYKTFIDYISIFVLFSAGSYFLAKLTSKPKETDKNEIS